MRQGWANGGRFGRCVGGHRRDENAPTRGPRPRWCEERDWRSRREGEEGDRGRSSGGGTSTRLACRVRRKPTGPTAVRARTGPCSGTGDGCGAPVTRPRAGSAAGMTRRLAEVVLADRLSESDPGDGGIDRLRDRVSGFVDDLFAPETGRVDGERGRSVLLDGDGREERPDQLDALAFGDLVEPDRTEGRDRGR